MSSKFTKRIIPCLDVHAGRVVKGVNFVNLRDAGDPVEIAKHALDHARRLPHHRRAPLVPRAAGDP